ncbi:MAG: PAS domain S-box protein [Flavobacteriales bacterium]|nr:PAS domain S-box protein [Flavobacteriales bacterium]
MILRTHAFGWMMKGNSSKDREFKSLAPSAEMRSLLDHTSRSVIILDHEFRILWFNARAAKEMFGFFQEELKTGNSYWDYVDQHQNKRFIRNFNTALNGRTISTEQRVKKPDNSADEIWVEGRFSPLLNDQGTAAGVIYSYKNISDLKRTERQASEKTQVLQAINHNSSQGFILLDDDDRIMSCNLMAPAMIATMPNELDPYGQNIIKCIHPDWKQEFLNGIKVARGGGSVSVELEKPGLENNVIEVRFTPVKHSVGKKKMVSIWAFDITDKKKAEKDVKRSEENLRAVFDSSSQTFYLVDRKLNVLAFNQAAFAIIKEQFGIELKVGMSVLDITSKENLVQFRIETERAFSGRKVQVEKHFNINGKDYWFDRHINPVVNSNGESDRLSIWSIDITDRKKAEKALKENESKFRKLASLLPVGIYQVDENGNATYVNESLQLIIGTDLTSILDGSWTENIHTEDRARVKSSWKAVEKNKKPFSMEYRFKRPNGNALHVLEQAQPLFNHLGEYRGYLGTIIDISEQKKSQQLFQAKQVAENSLKFRSDFLASMSHEIRTPLNGIMGLSEILLSSKLTTDQKSKLENILDASKDLRSIVNDVLNLSELEAGKVKLQLESFHLSQLIETIAERYEPEAKTKGLSLNFSTLKNEVQLDTDRRRLTQVLSNLVRNAIKFTDKGSVSVSVEVDADNLLLIKVADTGQGIPKEDQKKLFQDFSQLQHTTAQNLEGTGLGLSISKKLMQLLGGKIGVESTVGTGSTFWLSLPIRLNSIELKPISKVTSKPIKSSVQGTKVLLVEDNLINQQAFKIMLQRMGCKVDVLSNGKQAVENFEKSKYDIVFMDIQMPEMDGLEATTEIKRRYVDVPPVIGLSGNVLQRDDDGNLKSDMDDLLLKPVVSNDIERMIKKWVA